MPGIPEQSAAVIIIGAGMIRTATGDHSGDPPMMPGGLQNATTGQDPAGEPVFSLRRSIT